MWLLGHPLTWTVQDCSKSNCLSRPACMQVAKQMLQDVTLAQQQALQQTHARLLQGLFNVGPCTLTPSRTWLLTKPAGACSAGAI